MKKRSTEKPPIANGGSPTPSEQTISPPDTSAPIQGKEKKKLRNEITHKLRFQVLERDNYKCQYCGASPKTDDTVELTVDHIKPLSAGGKNDMENLITACASCNEGKKDTVTSRRFDVAPDVTPLFDALPIETLRSLRGKSHAELKAFFSNDASLSLRTYMHAAYVDDTDCVKDCAVCMETPASSNLYVECFAETLDNLPAALPAISLPKSIEAVQKSNPLVHEQLLQCDNCYATGRCPLAQVGGLCRFNFTLDMDFTDTKRAYEVLINLQRERVMRAALFEKVDGGVPDKNLTSEIQVLTGLMQAFDERGTPKLNMNLTATGGAATGASGGIMRALMEGILSGQSPAKQLPAQSTEGNAQLPAHTEVQDAQVVEEKEKVPVKKES